MRYLIPIAAADDLFPRAEFHFPKPLIEIDGEPMVARVIENIRHYDPAATFIFIVRAADCREFSLDQALIQASGGDCRVISLEQPTGGAVCTALFAVDLIEDNEPLVICNGDQVIEANVHHAFEGFARQNADAGVITFPSVHPRWSYVQIDEDGLVLEAAEKRVISRHAIAGLYYYRRGRDFVAAAKRSILNGRHVSGKYYLSPTLNEMILEGKKIASAAIEAEEYQSFYSPQRLANYQSVAQQRRLARRQKPAGEALTVVIPMAGLGSRFSAVGYAKPKPFIDVAGKTMIERVMDNLRVPGAKFVLIARREHLEQEPEVAAALENLGDVTFAPIDFTTEGAACTVLTARGLIPPDQPLLMANCDQLVDFDCAAFVEDARERQLDGSILVFRDRERDPKWSFAKLADTGLVTEVKEKVAISDLATVGLYYFGKARDFANAAIDMMARNDRVNNEFYVCPVYNYAIAWGARIGVYEVPSDAMHGLGTPSDLERFLALGSIAR